MSIQGTLAVKTYIKALLQFLRDRSSDPPEKIIEALKKKLSDDMGGWV